MIDSAANAHKSEDAMRFSQAAVNAANAYTQLTYLACEEVRGNGASTAGAGIA